MTRRNLFRALQLVALGAIGVVGLVVRFRHPELTETQLLLEFWPIWVAALALLLLSMAVNRVKPKPQALKLHWHSSPDCKCVCGKTGAK